MLIMVLVAQTLLDLPKKYFELYDDEILAAVLNKILQRLRSSSKVNNPVNDKECLSDRIEDFNVFLSELESFTKNCI